VTPEQFRQYGHQLIDLIADYRQTVGERPVMAQVEPGYLKAALPDTAPQQGEPFEAILDDVNQLVMPGLSHWQHPDFYGYFPSNGTLSSVLGDFLSTGLGVLGLSWDNVLDVFDQDRSVNELKNGTTANVGGPEGRPYIIIDDKPYLLSGR